MCDLDGLQYLRLHEHVWSPQVSTCNSAQLRPQRLRRSPSPTRLGSSRRSGEPSVDTSPQRVTHVWAPRVTPGRQGAAWFFKGALAAGAAATAPAASRRAGEASARWTSLGLAAREPPREKGAAGAARLAGSGGFGHGAWHGACGSGDGQRGAKAGPRRRAQRHRVRGLAHASACRSGERKRGGGKEGERLERWHKHGRHCAPQQNRQPRAVAAALHRIDAWREGLVLVGWDGGVAKVSPGGRRTHGAQPRAACAAQPRLPGPRRYGPLSR
jgi:hypothetical protein